MSSVIHSGTTHIFTDRNSGGNIYLSPGRGETLIVNGQMATAQTSMTYSETFDIGVLSPITTITNASVSATAKQGYAVAISGSTIAYSAPYDTLAGQTGPNLGSALIYTTVDNENWTLQQLISPSYSSCATYHYGGKVALSGDIFAMSLVQGDGGQYTGVYTRSAGVWTLDGVLAEKSDYGLYLTATKMVGLYYSFGTSYLFYIATKTGLGSWTVIRNSDFFTLPSCSDYDGTKVAIGLVAGNVQIYDSTATIVKTIVGSVTALKFTSTSIAIGSGTTVSFYDKTSYVLKQTVTIPGTITVMTGSTTGDNYLIVSTSANHYVLKCNTVGSWVLQSSTLVKVNTTCLAMDGNYYAIGYSNSTTNKTFIQVSSVTAVVGSSSTLISSVSVDSNGIDLYSLVPIDINADVTNVNSVLDSVSTTTGAMVIDGGIGVAKNITALSEVLTATTDSTTVATGSLITSGGIGVAKNITSLSHNLTSTTDSSSLSTGSFITAGGIGCAKTIYCTDLNVANSIKTAKLFGAMVSIYSNPTLSITANSEVVLVGNTQVTKDGFINIIVVGLVLSVSCGICLYSDAISTPTLKVGLCSVNGTSGVDYAVPGGSLCYPIKKNDYYRISMISLNSASTTTISVKADFIPIS